MDKRSTRREEIAEYMDNIDKEIKHILGNHPDDITSDMWMAVDKLTEKRKELKMEFDELCASNEPDMVNHPKHYEREGAMECIDEMEMIFGPEELMIYCKLATWKYRYRSADKGGAEDIAKSDWYMMKYRELRDKLDAQAEDNQLTITSTTPTLWR